MSSTLSLHRALSDSWPTRQTLLERAQDPNNETAWEEFVEYYEEFIHFVLNRLGHYGSENDDLTQEVMISIWKSLKESRYDKEKAKFRTWLSRVIKYKLIDSYRKNSTQQKLKQGFFEERSNDIVVDDGEFDAMIEQEWEVHLIKLALKNISSSYSEQSIQTFELAMQGLSDQEIAEKLDMKANSINKLKNRIQKRLAREIEALKDELESVS